MFEVSKFDNSIMIYAEMSKQARVIRIQTAYFWIFGSLKNAWNVIPIMLELSHDKL